MSDSLLVQLQQGVEVMGLTERDLPLQAYVSYVELLVQWNSAYNLTAVRDPEKMIAYHVLDSLSILPFIRGDQCLR
jgi:16S rRNA (guanine527-N7)-methyltransferase